MDPLGLLRDLFLDYTLRSVALGAGALGAVAGALGTFAVLRRQALLGDAISHAALPGIVLAFLLTGSRELTVLVAGAAVAGWLGAFSVAQITSRSRIPEDGALGIVLSVFFGLGLVLLTYTQRLPTAAQAGLDRFLFGQAATLVGRDVVVIVVLGALALLLTALFWKEFKLLSFDPAFGATLGFPMRRVEGLLIVLLVVAIVVGLQAVGVVLMSALVVAPAAAARQWTDALGRMVVLAGFVGAGSGVVGALASAVVPGLPTGPAIVVAASVAALGSVLIAPHRGVLPAQARRRRNRRRVRTDAVLLDLYALSTQHHGVDPGHPVAVLRTMAHGRGGVAPSLTVLEGRGHAQRTQGGGWRLTEEGARAARELLARHVGTDGGREA